jgi:hypothetical protein
MATVNYIYGVLVNGELPENHESFRFSNVSRSVLPVTARQYLDKLLPDTMAIERKAATANVLIRLLQSYDNYEQLINDIDPVNTYDDAHICASTDCISFPIIYEWAKKCPLRIQDVYAGELDDPVTVIQKAVIAICGAK